MPTIPRVLIEPGSQWPPPGHDKLRRRWEAWRAWWSGDPDELKRYGRNLAPGGYWARLKAKSGQREIHVPMAGDIARTSAEFVAGDTPTLDWGDDAAQQAWDELAQTIGWANTLLECAEVASPLGGAFLRPAWDKDTAAHPLPTVVPADEALPEFRFGILQAVTFVVELPAPAGWKALKTGEVWRWLEHHERGQIRHELWLGDASNVGRPVPLDEHPQTRGLQGQIDTSGIRDGLLVDYVPNMLPNPLVRLPLGKSDLQGIETLLDALDEAWDSWMRDIRLGKGRILLSREMLDPVAAQKASGSGGFLGGFFGGTRSNTTPAAAFDVDAEAFVGLEMAPDREDGTPSPITIAQFEIRYREHEATVRGLIEQIVGRAGWSPQTFGLDIEGQVSGTSWRLRGTRSIRTRDRKRRYMRPAVERCAETIMLINAVIFSGPRPAARPTLAWHETDQADPKETAEIIALLRNARAASTEVLVRMAHPEWDDEQVTEEVDRITAEDAAMLAPALDGTEPVEPTAAPTAPGVVTKEQADTYGLLWRSGVEPAEAARRAGIGDLTFIDNPRPVTVAPSDDEEGAGPLAAPPGAPAPAGKPPFPLGR